MMLSIGLPSFAVTSSMTIIIIVVLFHSIGSTLSTSSSSYSSSSNDIELVKLYLEEFRLEIQSMKSQLARMSRNSKLVRTSLKELKTSRCGATNDNKELGEYSNVDCPYGFELSTPSSCYKFMSDRVTWIDASARCQAINSHLVALESDAEHKLVANHLTNMRKLQNCDFWTSATDVLEEGVWKWNNTGHAVLKPHWHAGEPNNSNGGENCAWMDWYVDWAWNDAACHRDRACFICEVDI